MSQQPSLLIRLLRGFGQFWWDFLVGDTPELFGATWLVIAVTVLLSHVWHAATLATIVLPALVLGALFLTVSRSTPKKK